MKQIINNEIQPKSDDDTASYSSYDSSSSSDSSSCSSDGGSCGCD